MNAKIVIGLGFGDEGKGITTDYLCSQSPKDTIAIRFSGGQQAGHTVIVKDKKHICQNFAAGVLRGVPSYFTEHTSIYLNTIAHEKDIRLEGLGIGNPKLFVHPLAKMTTPYDVAYNQLTERINKHGSVGLGIAATNKRHLETGYKLSPVDLSNFDVFQEKLSGIKQYYLGKVKGEGLDTDDFLKIYAPREEYFMEVATAQRDGAGYFSVEDYDFLEEFPRLVFEGSQGIMLDMNHGIFPHVTWGNTTSKNAIEICRKLGIEPSIYYATRCYQTRHGNGWMTKVPLDKPLINNQEEINTWNEWQTSFKVSEIDYELLNYALTVDNLYSKGVEKNLVVTCLDQRPDFRFDYSLLNTEFNNILESSSPHSVNFTRNKQFA